MQFRTSRLVFVAGGQGSNRCAATQCVGVSGTTRLRGGGCVVIPHPELIDVCMAPFLAELIFDPRSSGVEVERVRPLGEPWWRPLLPIGRMPRILLHRKHSMWKGGQGDGREVLGGEGGVLDVLKGARGCGGAAASRLAGVEGERVGIAGRARRAARRCLF